MPGTRVADYYLGCLDGCVFIDFNLSIDSRISLRRISFDGYGCCDPGDDIIPMTPEESRAFIDAHQEDELNQEIIARLIIKTIEINRGRIWQDALKEYGLIE